MKKLLAILIALVCLTMLCVPALAVDGLDSLAIVGENIPGVGNWDPADAAGDMEMVSDGVYTKELTVTAGTTFKFKVAGNDAWVDSFNFGSATIVLGETAELDCGGGSGDMTVSIEKDCTLKITVDVNPMADGGKATILVEEVTGEETPDATEEPTEAPTDATEATTEATEEPTEATEGEDDGATEATQNNAGLKDVVETEEQKAERAAKRMVVYIVIAVALLVIVCIACLLSIPKKL